VAGERVPSSSSTAPAQAGGWARWWRHAWADEGRLRRALDGAAMDRLEARVGAAERGHSGEIRLCIEAALPWAPAWRGVTARARAVALFSELRVWDTAQNNGVLIYLLLAERAIEIVADRGLSAALSEADWQAVLQPLQAALAAGEFERGLGEAVDAVAAQLRARFALGADARDVDELPNRPRML